MFTLTTLLAFIGASILLILAPGPDILFVITQGISNGRKAGFFTALGLAFGNSIHTIGAALGVSIIFKTSPIAFTAFKILGAGYLFYLAYKAIKHRNDKVHLNTSAQINKKKLFAKGFVMNILNPKVALFFLAFLPQFANPETGSVPLQMITLGAIFILLVIVIFGSLGYFAGHIGDWLLKKPTCSKYLNLASAIIFIGIGINLILAHQ